MKFKPVYLLLVLPYLAMLWVPSYNRSEPLWLGIPYFYWYQLLWVPLSALIIGICYWATRDLSDSTHPH